MPIVAVASVAGRLPLAADGGPTDVSPPGGAPLASEKLVNASSVTAPVRVVNDSSPTTALPADAACENIGLAAATHKTTAEAAAVLAAIPYEWPTPLRMCGDEVTLAPCRPRT
jgi:hypothetical protein